jgi:hypothetical protein
VVVFGLTGWVAALAETTIHDRGLAGTATDAALQVATSFIGTFGFVFYAGMLDCVLNDYLEGRPDAPLRTIIRVLPLRRLFVADILVTIAVAVTLLLLVLPGLVVFSLLSLAGPAMVTERLRIAAAFRRSAQLVRTRFWLVAVLVTLPVMLEEEVLHAVDYHSFPHPLIAAFLIAGVLGAAVASVIGLVEVVLAFELRRRTPLRAAATTGTVPDAARP